MTTTNHTETDDGTDSNSDIDSNPSLFENARPATDVEAQLISQGALGGIRAGDFVDVDGDLFRVTDVDPSDDAVDVIRMSDGWETELWLSNMAADDGIDTAPLADGFEGRRAGHQRDPALF